MAIPKILAIEDNSADLLILRFALDQQGEPYDMQVLSDGAEALQFVSEQRTGKRPPNPCVILLDLHLPRHNGMQVLSAVKESPPLRHIKVMMLTGAASPTEQAQIAQMGALYRQKPSGVEDYIKLGAEIFRVCKSAVLTAA